jgi:hypothetical protein
VLVFDQIVLMLEPAVENNAAEANATNASINVYWDGRSAHHRSPSGLHGGSHCLRWLSLLLL